MQLENVLVFDSVWRRVDLPVGRRGISSRGLGQHGSSEKRRGGGDHTIQSSGSPLRSRWSCPLPLYPESQVMEGIWGFVNASVHTQILELVDALGGDGGLSRLLLLLDRGDALDGGVDLGERFCHVG